MEAKPRILYLLKILLERTDEEHPLSTTQLIGILNEEYGISAHRTTITKDIAALVEYGLDIVTIHLDCQHFFRQIFLGYFSDIVQAFDTLRKNVCGDDYTSLHNPIVLSSVLPAYGMFHSIQILFL